MNPIPDEFAESSGCRCLLSEDGSMMEVEPVGLADLFQPHPEFKPIDDENLC